jgi:hypothetical protein
MLPSNRVLKYQYRARNYQHYSELIQDLLQAEKHDELTIRNHHQYLVGTTPLLRSTIVQRVKKRCMITNHQRMLINSRKIRKTSTRKTNPNTKVWGKEINPSSATAVVVLIILQRSAIYPNTWSTCTRNSSKG